MGVKKLKWGEHPACWEEHFKTLEIIRSSGAINMLGAAQALEELEEIDREVAREIHIYWMTYYDKILEKGIITRRN